LQKIRRVLRFLQREMGKKLSEVLAQDSDLHLVTDGKSIYLEDRSDRIIDILKNARQPMFLVCVTDQIRRINAALKPAAPKKPVRTESSPVPVRRVRAV
jgi:tRNA G46 methylase TrmB